MLHREDVINAPMKMVRDIRYLLIDALQGVAYDSPRSAPRSTSKSWAQDGHFTFTAAVPSSFTPVSYTLLTLPTILLV